MKEFSVDDTAIRVDRGEVFVINAGAVATGGGFRWLSDCDDPSIEEVESRFEARSGGIGGASVQRLVFRATGSGVFELRLRYQQGRNPPRKERPIQVTVSPD